MPRDDDAYINLLAQKALAARDEAAWRELYEVMTPRLFGFACRLGANQSDAEEVVAETWSRIVTANTRYDAQRGAFSTYAFWRAANVWRDLQRHKRRRPTEGIGERDPAGHEPQAADDLLYLEYLARLPECVQGLTQDQREVFSKHWQDQLPHDTIAEQLNKPPGTIRRLYATAVRNLFKCLGIDN